jgi:hypothetical protein
VVAAWVVFRAETFDSAIGLLRSMAGLNGLLAPDWLIVQFGGAKQEWVAQGLLFDHMFTNRLFRNEIKDPLGLWLLLLLLIVHCAPNTQELLGRYCPALDPHSHQPAATTLVDGRVRWHANFGWGLAAGLAFGLSILALPEVSPFLYFQF